MTKAIKVTKTYKNDKKRMRYKLIVIVILKFKDQAAI